MANSHVAASLTHFDADGRPRMVDVTNKQMTSRHAIATSAIKMLPTTFALAMSGNSPKGDVRIVAELAGVMAAKRTSDLIPLCHPLALTSVKVEITPDDDAAGFTIEANVSCTGPTGVEMEAMTAASIAALTLYDMLKAVDRGMIIGPTRLIEKSGGKSGLWQATK
jgi:cyclic pyranopterin monophosphate synthase